MKQAHLVSLRVVISLVLATTPSVVANATSTSGRENDQHLSNNKKNNAAAAAAVSLSFPSPSRPASANKLRPADDKQQPRRLSTSFTTPVRTTTTATTSSLSERLSMLLGDTAVTSSSGSSDGATDFYSRLLAEEQEAIQQQQQQKMAAISSSKSHSNHSSLLWTTALMGCLLTVVASCWITTAATATAATATSTTTTASTALVAGGSGSVMTSFFKELFHLSTSIGSVVWIPLLWIRPQSVVEDTWTYVQHIIVGHQSNNNNIQALLRYFQTEILPQTGKMLQKMFIAELWGRFWSALFKQVDQWLKDPPTKHSTSSSSSSSSNGAVDKADNNRDTLHHHHHQTRNIPTWLQDGHAFVTTAIQKGVKKLVKSSLQKQFQASMVTVASFALAAIRNQMSFSSSSSLSSSFLDDGDSIASTPVARSSDQD